MAVFRPPELVELLVCVVLSTLWLARGFQIIHRREETHYGRAIAWIILGTISAFIAVATVWLCGFGVARFLR
jgi:hypothetical protein